MHISARSSKFRDVIVGTVKAALKSKAYNRLKTLTAGVT